MLDIILEIISAMWNDYPWLSPPPREEEQEQQNQQVRKDSRHDGVTIRRILILKWWRYNGVFMK